VDVAVVGAGVVGCAIARHLARDGASVLLLDRAADVGDGTSKANTAILHTGFDTDPGSLESALVGRGRRLLVDYALAAGIAVEPTGALLVAWDDEQERALPALLDKAVANGCTDASLVGADEVRSRERHLGPGARSGLAVPGEWAIDPWSVTLAFATEAVGAGVLLRLGAPVTGVAVGAEGHEVEVPDGSVRARWLVNAAGLTDRASVADADIADWTKLFEVNARAPFFLMQHAIKAMRERKQGGAIVNILSMNAHCGSPELAVYSATKAALALLTKNAANAHRRDRIRVNGIMMGWSATPAEMVMQGEVLGHGPGWVDKAAASLPFGRLLAAEEVANLAIFLLSDAAGPMTGALVDQEQWVAGAKA